MMNVIRKVVPVGQGLFCHELFICGNDIIRIVYDCGSNTKKDAKKTIIENRIESEFSKDTVIDALFISHFDADHINGIKYLTQHCHVKKIYYPLITEKYYSLLKIIYGSDLLGFIESFPFASSSLNVKRIVAVYQEGQQTNSNLNPIKSGDNVWPTLVSEDKECFKDKEWLLIPYNFDQEENFKKLKEKIMEIIHVTDDADFDIFADDYLNDKNRDETRKSIEDALKLLKNKNLNSMVLFSGPNQNNESLSSQKTGCIYTGDAPLKTKNQWKGFSELIEGNKTVVGCIQVPHHGSKYSFNSELLSYDCDFVISAGSESEHPHSEVLRKFYDKGKCPIKVTEKDDGYTRSFFV